MNNKPNIPGEVVIADQEFSLPKAWKVNAWLFVAALTSALSDVIYSQALREWPVGWRLGFAAWTNSTGKSRWRIFCSQ